jgi:hypothetical protein
MENKVLFTITEGTPIALALQGVAETANRYFKAQHSVEYWAEEVLTSGITAKLNYIKSDKTRRETAAFAVEMARMTPPTNVSDVNAMANYASQVSKLRSKYHIGGTAVEV